MSVGSTKIRWKDPATADTARGYGRLVGADMPDATCTIEGCNKPRYQRRDMCGSHFMKSYRYGDPHYIAPSPTAADLTGMRFGELTALSRDRGLWLCVCDCGNQKRIRIGDLRRGSIRSCGERPTHPRKQIVTYAGAHDRVEAIKGRAKLHDCVDCGGPAHEWSYDHADPNELHDTLPPYFPPYSLDPDHYDPRCITCHRRFDRQRAA